MNEKLKTGIIGCGKVADIHAAAFTTMSPLLKPLFSET